MRHPSAGQPARWGLLATFLALTACAPAVRPTGDMTPVMSTLGPAPLVASLDRPDRWVMVGRPSADQLRLDLDESLPAVYLAAGRQAFTIGHRVDRHLLAQPYLTWRWKLAAHPGPLHPVRVVVGFTDASAPLPAAGTLDHLPDGTRVLELVWSSKALGRGSLDRPVSDDAPARYIVRGGEEALGRQWSEGVDLITLHDRAWPGRSTSDTRIVFVGVRVEAYNGPPPPPAALISGLNLIR